MRALFYKIEVFFQFFCPIFGTFLPHFLPIFGDFLEIFANFGAIFSDFLAIFLRILGEKWAIFDEFCHKNPCKNAHF